MSKKPRREVLLIEDNPGDVGLIRSMFLEQTSNDTTLTHVARMSEAEQQLATRAVDIILLDLGLPDARGLDAVRRARAAAPLVPLVVLTGDDDELLAVQALQEGAQDYLIKGELEARGLMRALHYAAERIKVQRELVESKRVFEDIFHNSDAAIIDRDFSGLFRIVQDLKHDGVLDLRGYIAESDERLNDLADAVHINGANESALRLFGVSSPQDIVRPKKNLVDIAEAILQGVEVIKQSEYITTNGRLIPIICSLRIPQTEEEARRVPVIIIDLSNVKLAEAARQATIAKSQFLSSMSHEIRTPLNGVIGNLELLALTSLDNDQFELIDDAGKAAKALLALIGNILDFSKIEAGKLTTEIGDINPAALAEEAVGVLQSVARQKKIFIVTTVGADVPILVRGDAVRTRQILLNLIGNAAKFTEQGGVQMSVTATALDHERCELRFCVRDSGRGFDQSQAAMLFEPFARERSVNRDAEGTGLGLSICKNLVAALGGAIGCDGAPGRGATFWFTLPVTIVKPALPAVHPDLSGVRAMVIGRDDSTAKSLERYFTSRRADVALETYRTAFPFVLGYKAGEAPVDIAVLIPDDNDEDIAAMAGLLRQRNAVPLLYGIDQLSRTRLRQGFAAVVPISSTAAHLDRNVDLLLDRVRQRGRTGARLASIVPAFDPNLRGIRVLVLEDGPMNQTVIRKQLNRLGIDCMLAPNGVLGLEALDRQDFDLVLCDCSMPVMNGYEFTRALRGREAANPTAPRLPVIALTASAFREDADMCFEAGMDDFISKPAAMDRLAATLVKWAPSRPAAAAPAA